MYKLYVDLSDNGNFIEVTQEIAGQYINQHNDAEALEFAKTCIGKHITFKIVAY